MKLTYATTNTYKIMGANKALKGVGIELVAPDTVLPEVSEIQSETQREVCVDKAVKYHALLRTPLVVMDSGLFISGLGGFPGVYTKYVIHTIGVQGILELVKNKSTSAAYTQRTVVYFDGETMKVFESKIHGKIIPEKRGTNGRDYDFIFLLSEHQKTTAELTDSEQTEVVSRVWLDLAEWLRAEGRLT